MADRRIFHLGAAGVAIATVISNVLSSALVIIYLHKRPDEFRFQIRNMSKIGGAFVTFIF